MANLFYARTWIVLGLVGVLAVAAWAGETISEPYRGVRLIHRVDTLPRPLSIHVVEIDLSDPDIRFRLTPPKTAPEFDPPTRNGVPDETITQTVRDYVNEQGAQIGINASFYRLEHHSFPRWTNNISLAVSDGIPYSPWSGARATAINISRDNVAQLITAPADRPTGYETSPEVELYNAVGGSGHIVTDGVVTGGGTATKLHPRTAIGYTADGKLLLVTVDGRQPGYSEGVYLNELGQIMLDYGAVHAINLDGGGSTTLAFDYYDDTDGAGQPYAARLINSPVGRGLVSSERYNGTNLAVFAAPNPDYRPARQPTVPDAVTVLDDFETDVGRFNSAAVSGSNRGISPASTFARVLDQSYHGEGALRLVIQPAADTSDAPDFSDAPVIALRHLSGGGLPAHNIAFPSTGYIGFLLKVHGDWLDDGDYQVAIILDDGSAHEQSVALDVIADGRWHLYQWNLEDAEQWHSFANGNGRIDADTVTLDSIYLTARQGRRGVFYLDLVAHYPAGALDDLLVAPE